LDSGRNQKYDLRNGWLEKKDEGKGKNIRDVTGGERNQSLEEGKSKNIRDVIGRERNGDNVLAHP